MNLVELETRTRDDLIEVAKELGLSGTASLRKQELVFRILQARAEREGNVRLAVVLRKMAEELGPPDLGLALPEPPASPS